MNAVIGIGDGAIENPGDRIVLDAKSGIDVVDECVGHADKDTDPHRDAFVDEVVKETAIDEHARSIRTEFSHVDGIGVEDQATANGATPDVRAFLAEIEIDAVAAVALVLEETIIEVIRGHLTEDLLVAGDMAASHVEGDGGGLTEGMNDGRAGCPVVMEITVLQRAGGAAEILNLVGTRL